MLKKILLSTAIASLTSMSFANCLSPYVGASIGIDTNTSSSVPVSNVPVTVTQPGNYRGMPFTVFAGYGGQINQNFNLLGEVFWKIGTADISNHDRLKTSYAYGVSVLPGVLLSESTVGYVRLGIVRTQFTDANSTRTGAQLGAGLQTNVTQNVDVRGEYDYYSYSSFNGNVGRYGSPTTDSFSVALIYKFD